MYIAVYHEKLIHFLFQVALGYHFFQCLAFVVMATLIMRLKLFLTPLMAVLSGMITSNKVLFNHTHHQSRTYVYDHTYHVPMVTPLGIKDAIW